MKVVGNEARFYLLLMGLSTLTFWSSFWGVEVGSALVMEILRKFVCYLSLIVWLNAVYWLKRFAESFNVNSWEFQKEQVQLTLLTVGILIVSELPLWIASLSHP